MPTSNLGDWELTFSVDENSGYLLNPVKHLSAGAPAEVSKVKVGNKEAWAYHYLFSWNGLYGEEATEEHWEKVKVDDARFLQDKQTADAAKMNVLQQFGTTE